jgi:transcription elongation regulator 1
MTEEDIMWQLQQMEGSEEEEQEQEEPEEQVVIEEEEPVEEAAPVEKKIELTEEERIAQFNELLQERHISPFAMYSTEYPELMNDPRFSCKY